MSSPSPEDCWEDWAELDRQQFASELHDGLLPLLFGARMHAERLAAKASDPEWGQELTMLVDELAAAMNEGRRLLVDVHPPEFQEGNWHDALRYYAEHGLPTAAGVGQEGTKRAARIDFDLQPATLSLPPQIAGAAYRIAQEAMRNAVRHGQAENVMVRASDAGDGTMTLQIRDDGRGFDVDRIPSDRFGVRSMAARAESAGGSTTLTSQPGQGTTVSAQLPLIDPR